jgi:hypothetical protein
VIERCPSRVQAHEGLLQFSGSLRGSQAANRKYEGAARVLVSTRFELRPSNQITVRIFWRDPSLKHNACRLCRARCTAIGCTPRLSLPPGTSAPGRGAPMLGRRPRDAARSPEMLPFGPLADLNSQTSEQPDCAQLADRGPDRSPSLGWSWHITGVQQVAGRVIGPEPRGQANLLRCWLRCWFLTGRSSSPTIRAQRRSRPAPQGGSDALARVLIFGVS